jgi:hypothetical protein
VNCGTCKHWDPVSGSYGPVPTDWVASMDAEKQHAAWKARNGDVGACRAAVETRHVELDAEVPLLMVQDGSSYSAVMFTRKAFRCVLHSSAVEPKVVEPTNEFMDGWG